ncbi:MAG: N-formylglutamate amidohydrolase [Amaricoccus sp.]|uniref:N-formylglutamate amidohydrolase n=1 Tax=Amaricoccus sp. TaxID=1872485 RepID=UPI0039E3120D
MEDAFTIALPADHRSCAVFSSPHSGRDYPAALTRSSRLTLRQLRSSEDAFVEELFAAAPAAGAPLIAARAPRAWVDLNRGPEDLDPALIAGASRAAQNPRIAAGLGVIPRVVGEGRAIIEGKLSLADAERRIAAVWRPFHARLASLVAETRATFGVAVLFDCHSMPHDALNATPSVWGRRPNVILGDRFGTACDRWVIDLAADVFGEAGFLVARNTPFAGGYITQTYGCPRRGVHALQIEIDRALYMDESRVERSAAFAEVAARLAEVTHRLAAIRPRSLPMAAE